MTPISALLSGVVDYAGLFPPAQLPLPVVVDNYRRYASGPHHWMLGRLILPFGKLGEAANRLEQIPESSSWKISALIPSIAAPDGALEKALAAVTQFNSDNEAQVDALEGKLTSADQLIPTLDATSREIDFFLEIPHQAPQDLIAEIARAGRSNVYAKIRCGGVTEDLIPSSAQIARFLSTCASEQVGFKATAGLHHPFRAKYALTYLEDSPRGRMHGFLNVFLAACFAYTLRWSVEQLVQVLDEEDAASFSVEADAVLWRDSRATANQLQAVRKKWAISFGSCSFEEPVTDLQDLGWLLPAANQV